MSPASTVREGLVERLRREGRMAEALGLVLGRTIPADRTIAVPCLAPGHVDRHSSAIVQPQIGRVSCAACGASWGLLDLAVHRGLGADRAAAARALEARLYGTGSAVVTPAKGRAPGAKTPSWRQNPPLSRLEREVLVPVPGGAVSNGTATDDDVSKIFTETSAGRVTPPVSEHPFPFVTDDMVRALGWQISRRWGRATLRLPVVDGDLQLCAVKVRRDRRPDGHVDAFLEHTADGRREAGLIHAEGLADLGPGALVLVLAGETDLLAFYAAAARERTYAVAVSPSNGEGTSMASVAQVFIGLRVVIVFDVDDPGRAGAAARFAEIAETAQQVAVLELPFTAEQSAGGCKDVRDWLGLGGTAEGLIDLAEEALRAQEDAAPRETYTYDDQVSVDDVATAPRAATDSDSSKDVLTWKPFPVETLPPALADLVQEGALAIGCDPSYIALTALAVAAGATGNSRTIELKPGWREPAVLWTAIVGESGTHKSPAQDEALFPLRRRDDDAQRRQEEDLRLWRAEKMRHDVELAAWRKEGAEGDPPEEPERPAPTRFIVADVTTEAIAKLLSDNPRGLLLMRDELSGWLRSFDAYRGGVGGDTAFYLSSHGARPHVVDRKGGDRQTIFVPRAALSICGGIQPGILASCIGREHAEDGLLARMLLAHPPRIVRSWSTASVSKGTRARYAAAIDGLLALDLVPDADGVPGPVALPLERPALSLWITFFNAFAARQANALGDEAAALSKLEGAAARLALLHQLLRDPAARAVDAEAIAAGTALASWFADELVRVYRLMTESPEEVSRRRLIEWIAARGGQTTVRELSHGPREYRKKEHAEAALEALVAEGLARFEERSPGARGGRPTRVVVLREGAVEEVRKRSHADDVSAPRSGGTGTKTSESSLG